MLLFKAKEERYSIGEFLKGHHQKKIISQTPVYGLIGLDMSSSSMFSDFNMPYLVVFGVAGVVILSTIIENIFIAHGNPRKAEKIEAFTKLIMPIGFYAFLVYGIMTIL